MPRPCGRPLPAHPSCPTSCSRSPSGGRSCCHPRWPDFLSRRSSSRRAWSPSSAPRWRSPPSSTDRAGVIELLRRVFRWRVAPGWYLLATAGVPVAALLAATAVSGRRPLDLVLAHPAQLLPLLTGLTVVLLINLWEETGWMGFVQARLQARRGALRAALLTAPLFALIHLPLLVGLPPRELTVD